jgi:hypothetical protein
MDNVALVEEFFQDFLQVFGKTQWRWIFFSTLGWWILGQAGRV